MKTKAAAALTAAKKKQHRSESYQRPVSESRLKLTIGELLLFGDRQQPDFWTFIEKRVRQYVDSPGRGLR